MAPVELVELYQLMELQVARMVRQVRVTPVVHPVDDLALVLRELSNHPGESLWVDEQRVLRACLRLAGQPLPLLGTCDAAFYAALDAYQTERGQTPGLDALAIADILDAARRAVGASGRLARAKAAWFDAFKAPRLLRELSSVALLIRALRHG